MVERPQKPPFSGMYTHPMNVIEAAKRRIAYCIDTYDEIVVSFSGGKDSLVLLELVDMVYKERGITKKLQVKFMDEELVSDQVIQFVQSIAESGRFDFRWYCLPMAVGFFVMGKHRPFFGWDPARKWHRQPPPYAITDIGVNVRVHNENTLDSVMYPDTSVRVCGMTGVRAQESMKRLQSISKNGRKPGSLPNYLSGINGAPHMWTAKPIYDMTETDIFKFFKEYRVPYCECYDGQLYSKAPLRVASALYERSSSQFFKLKQIEPAFYATLREAYPEIEAYYRYWGEVDRFSVIAEYPRTFEGIRQYVRDKLDASQHKEAFRFINGCEVARINNLKRDPDLAQVLGYMPVRQIFMIIVTGRFSKGTVMRFNVGPEDVAFEQAQPGLTNDASVVE